MSLLEEQSILQIVSDGTSSGTRICYPDGRPFELPVTRIVLTIDAKQQAVTAEITAVGRLPFDIKATATVQSVDKSGLPPPPR